MFKCFKQFHEYAKTIILHLIIFFAYFNIYSVYLNAYMIVVKLVKGNCAYNNLYSNYKP